MLRYIPLVISIILVQLIIVLGKNILCVEKNKVKNYRNNKIPNCGGLFFLFSFNISILFLVSLMKDFEKTYLILLIGSNIIGLIGLIDDFFGVHDNTKGIKGHFKELCNLNITTGMVKAILGLLFSYLIIILTFKENGIDVFIKTLMLALMINFFNLIDLRPGRTIKFFILFMLIIFVKVQNNNQLIYMLIAGSVIGYLPYDLKEKFMMGDIGSNILGFWIGYFILITSNILTIIILTLFLITIHVILEKASLTKAIMNNRILNFFDMLGRIK